MKLRPAGPGDFTIEVDGVGTFIFGRRRQRDVYRIRGEYNRLTGGGNYDEDGNFADLPALAHATLSVLTVQAPDGFDLDELDPLTEDSDAKLMKVFMALREKELSFRPRGREESEAESQADRE